MKRKFFYVLLCICLALNAFVIRVWADGPQDWDISLSAEHVTPTGMTLVITRTGSDGNGFLRFGDAYWLEIYTAGNWVQVPYIDDVAFTDILNGVSFKGEITEEIDWGSMYGTLSPGQYRFAKEYFISTEAGDSNKTVYYANFMIEGPHSCISRDFDAFCDICDVMTEHECEYERNYDICDLCGQPNPTVYLKNPDWGISLSVENLTATSLTLVIRQSGGSVTGELEFGEQYHLETFTDGTWEPVPYIGTPAFTMIGYILPLNATETDAMNWEYMYGELLPGRYRVAKEFTDFRDFRDYHKAVLYAEFEISEANTNDCALCAQNMKAQRLTQAEYPDWGVSLYVEDITATGLTLVMNQSQKGTGEPIVIGVSSKLEYDTCFSLQVYQNGRWEYVPEITQMVCPLEADNVRMNDCVKETLDWQRQYGTLPEGHYRIKKAFFDDAERAQLYTEFLITQAHTCHSEDGDLLCDHCLALVKHRSTDNDSDGCCDVCGLWDVYRVVGNADWLGNWDPASDLGRMIRLHDDSYKIRFSDVPPGEYEIKVTKNGTWDESWGDEGENFHIEVANETDLIVDFRFEDGKGYITVRGGVCPPPDTGEESAVTGDRSLLPAAILLCACVPTVFILNRRKRLHIK